MTTISGSDLLAIESLRADVARLTAERDEARRSVTNYAAGKRMSEQAAEIREEMITSRDATIAELRALLGEAVKHGLEADIEGWPQPTTRSDRLRSIATTAGFDIKEIDKP